jgi:hypothetical protein
LECEEKGQVAYCEFFYEEIDAQNEYFPRDKGKYEEEEEAQIECFIKEREN